MHKVRTAWPVATRVEYLVAYEECRRRWGLSARRFCAATEIPVLHVCPLVGSVVEPGQALLIWSLATPAALSERAPGPRY